MARVSFDQKCGKDVESAANSSVVDKEAAGGGPPSSQGEPGGETPLGKRKRQPAAQMNISDWSTQDYNRCEDSRSNLTAAEVIGASPANGGELKRSRLSQKIGHSGRPGGDDGENSDGHASGADGAGKGHSQRLAALLRPPKVARCRQPLGGRKRHSSRGAAGGLSAMVDFAASTSHSSSDEDSRNRVPGMCNPMRLLQERGRDMPEAEPVVLDASVDLSAVGGLWTQIEALKECALHPLVYPELYEALGVVPPRGVLLHGPPGCGKTLVARALAGACRQAGLPITLFARKGSDVTSKFVGESEQRLCTLFETARRRAPSIIFFDELDGLTPARSDSGSDTTSHQNAVVATLLALMDGLTSRGQVVVLGATNRPDLLDSALRRPGRFDREVHFALPSAKERLHILEVLTQKWPCAAREGGGHGALLEILRPIAFERSAGLSGADLRALCAEAAIRSIRRTYPQIYSETRKVRVDPQQIQVTIQDFEGALHKVAAPRVRSRSHSIGVLAGLEAMPATPMSMQLAPLLQQCLRRVQKALAQAFPPWGGACSSSDASALTAQHLAFLGGRVLLRTPNAALLQLLEPALLWSSELPVFRVELNAVAAAPEGAALRLQRIVATAIAAAPSVVAVPNIAQWNPHGTPGLPDDDGASPAALLRDVLKQMPPEAPVLVLCTHCTTGCAVAEHPAGGDSGTPPGAARGRKGAATAGAPCDSGGGGTWTDLLALFEAVRVSPPSMEDIKVFLCDLFRHGLKSIVERLLEEQHQQALQAMEPLPAELPITSLDKTEIVRQEREELFWERVFRNQVRQVLHALSRFTRFSIFSKPPDALRRATRCGGGGGDSNVFSTEGPVTIGEMMSRNNARGYSCIDDVRSDFQRILANIEILFADQHDHTETRVRAYARELVDKAEMKLDCIDEEAARMIARMHARREQRSELLRQQSAKEAAAAARAAEEASQASAPAASQDALPAAAHGNAEQKVAPPQPPQTELNVFFEMPAVMEEALQRAVVEIIRTLQECQEELAWFSELLVISRRLQGNICRALLALSPAPAGDSGGPGIVRSHRSKAAALLRQLTDAFAKDYLPPGPAEGLTAASLMTRRISAFSTWLKQPSGGIAGTRATGVPAMARQISVETVALLLREEKIQGKHQRLKKPG